MVPREETKCRGWKGEKGEKQECIRFLRVKEKEQIVLLSDAPTQGHYPPFLPPQAEGASEAAHFHLAQKGGKEESIRSEEVPISLWACTPPLLSVPLGAKSRRRRQGKGEERSGQFFIPYPTSEAAGSPPLNLRRTGVPRGVFSFCAAANLNLAPLDLDGVSLHHSPFSRRNSFSFSISSWSAIF